MKKTVRIRKAKPGETPGYINKTKQFLQKANVGLSVGQDAQRMQQMYNAAYISLMNETPADIVYYNIIDSYGVDANTANVVLQSAFQQLVNEGYINPEMMQNQQNQNQTVDDQNPQNPQGPSEEELAAQEEENQLAMSEAEDDDNYHIDDYAAEDDESEEQMQQQAFKKYGGYFDMGGSTEQDPVLDQYDRAGNIGNQPVFSLDDLIDQQAGVQLFNPASAQIYNYLGDYQSIGGWGPQQWLGKKGGSVPKLPKYSNGGSSRLLPYFENMLNPFIKGYDWYNKIAPMQNVSALGRALPIFTGLGYAAHKTPGLNWMLGMKAGPQQLTHATQNIYELNKVVQGAKPTEGIFSLGNANSNELSVDRLMFATEDLQNIISQANTEGRSTFTFGDVSNGEGAVSGIYGKDSKITLGVDDQGNKFFDISTKFNPGDKTPFGVIPSNAKTTAFRNRFYYKPNEQTGAMEFFDGLGNTLLGGTTSQYKITRPIVPSLYRNITGGLFNDPSSTLGTKGILGFQTGPGIINPDGNSFLNNLVNRTEITNTPPATWSTLGPGRAFGRGLEQLGYQIGTFPFGVISSMAGYNPIRTMGKNVQEMPFNTLGYSGGPTPNAYNPALETGVGEDFMRNTDWFRRKGANIGLGLGLGTALGFGIYDSLYGEPDPVPVGPKKTLLPRNRTLDNLEKDYQYTVPDTLQGLGLPYRNTPNYNLELRRNTNTWEVPDWDTIPENYKKGGSVQLPKADKGRIMKSALNLYKGFNSGFKGFENVAQNAHKVYLPNSTKNLLRNININTLGAANTLAKTALPVMVHPARIPVFGNPIEGVGSFTGSPLNDLPFYGYEYPNSVESGLPGMAFRKMGDSLDWVKNTGIISPAHGSPFRMGYDQVAREGNWAEPGYINERYPGVFMAAFNPNVAGSKIQIHNSPRRNGVLVNEGMDKPFNSIMDPGVSLHRRLPFSNRYVPVDMEKLMNDQFDWKTMGGNAQSLLERFGYWGIPAAAGAALGFSNPVHDWYNENIYQPIGDAFEEVKEYMQPEKKKEGGKISKSRFTKQLLSFYDEGGENPNDPNTIGKGNRMDTAVRDVKKINDGFISNLKNDANTDTTSKIYDLAQDNPEIMNTLMANGYKENLAEDQGQPMTEAKYGINIGNIPSWYRGYMNSIPTPSEYKRYFKQLKKMMPRGNDIRRARYASSIGGFPFPEATLTHPGYMSMFQDYALGNHAPFMGAYYGGGYQTPNDVLQSWGRNKSSQDLASEVEIINNSKNSPFLGVHRNPRVGETWDMWWTSNGSTPGFRPDKRIWNGSEWVHRKEDLQNFNNSSSKSSDINDYMNFFSGMKMKEGGFADDPCPEGSYWDEYKGECVPYAEGVPSREELFNNPEMLDYLNKLNKKRNVQEYRNYRDNKLYEYIEQNYKGPMKQHEDGTPYIDRDSPEWEKFKNSEEYKKLRKSLPDTGDDGPFNFPEGYEQKDFFPSDGEWDEDSKRQYNNFFNPNPSDYENKEKILEEYILQNPDVQQRLNELEEQGNWIEQDKLRDNIYQNIPEEERQHKFKLEELLKNRYDDWCPCQKTQEIFVQGRPVQQTICVPCEQAQVGGFVNMNDENPLTKFVYGGNETNYYEPYGLTEASNGIEITNELGENRMVADVMPFDEWAEGEKDDFATTHPGIDFDTWKAGDESGDDYQKYADFHHKSLKEYEDFGSSAKPKVGETKSQWLSRTTGNPGYYDNTDVWDGTKWVKSNTGNNNNTNNTNTPNCPPGYVFSKQYGQCVPMAKINYNYRRGPASSGGLFRTLAPWNPGIARGASWMQQTSLPHYLNSGEAYYGKLKDRPDAVIPMGWLGLKKMEINNIDGDGVSIDDIERLRNMYDPRYRRKSQRQDRRDQRNQTKESRSNNRSQLEDDIKKRYGYSDEEWDNTNRRDKRRERIAERYEQGRGMRYKTNQAWENLKDSSVGDAARFYGNIGKKILKPFMKKEYGGIPKASFGMAKPYDPNTGYSMGIGQNQSAYNQYSPQSQFEKDLFGSAAPNSTPQMNFNPFGYINTTGLGSYGETRDTGVTLDQQGQNVIERNNNITNPPPQPQQPKKDNLVGVEKRKRWMWNFDPEAALNVGNAAGRWTANAISGIGEGNRQRNFTLDNVATEQNYANSNDIFAGNWGATTGQGTGMFRYDQEGQIASGRAANVTQSRYGGYMKRGGYSLPYLEEGAEVFMTQEELENYLAAGGQVEYLY